ncbi:hypothetical protein PTTG_08551 [Puccinia triticina 1-1 BBBD Race 1]|uniref:Uncharacterized protein n=1 Tax=Puccinia triticina (isolate 1-1 / race 1 (BBBD)) TaxID=630390 RepID=A0A0C4F5Z6_PUCT1|nr:hypothetical protein PTTG_08551 [Puccinia triticina 1-1 BBBD Race 1]WAR60862.1 hypothetical protein PtB15_13B108 [Puccinia triticina]
MSIPPLSVTVVGGARGVREDPLTTGIQCTRIAMLVYWWLCLLAIGGWTSYLVRKRRSLRNNNNNYNNTTTTRSETGRLTSWRSSWTKIRLGLLSIARSGSPAVAAVVPPNTSTTTTTLASSLRYIADALRSPPTRPLTQPASPASKSYPRELLGQAELLV